MTSTRAPRGEQLGHLWRRPPKRKGGRQQDGRRREVAAPGVVGTTGPGPGRRASGAGPVGLGGVEGAFRGPSPGDKGPAAPPRPGAGPAPVLRSRPGLTLTWAARKRGAGGCGSGARRPVPGRAQPEKQPRRRQQHQERPPQPPPLRESPRRGGREAPGCRRRDRRRGRQRAPRARRRRGAGHAPEGGTRRGGA